MALLTLFPAASAGATEFYVSPNGSPSGDGSAANPWDLQTALNQPSTVKPGDTIWVHGGMHRQSNRPTKFVSRLAGASGQPITLRAYPGERATIDGNLLQTTGGWVNYWGLEIMDSQEFGGGMMPIRSSSQSGPWPTTWWVTYDGNQTDFCVSGADLRAPNCKLINMVIHDNIGGGIGMNTAAGDTEVYGSLSYYNGWQGPDRAHGHGIYGQNVAPTTKHIIDCFIFDNYALGMQATGSGPSPIADNFDVEGSAFFLNGGLAASHQANLLLGAYQGQAQNPVVLTNFIYDTMGSSADFYLGYDGGSLNAVCEGNYFQTSAMFSGNANMTLAGNTFVNGTLGLNQSAYPNNNFLITKPVNNVVSVRPNKYEPGRANIIIYNWEHLNSVAVDVSQVLPAGTSYEVRNAQDFYGTPVATGTYNGGYIIVPTMGLSVAQPVGANAPAASGPDFCAFILLPTSVTNSHTAPIISPIGNQTINANTPPVPILFTVQDAQTAADNLSLSAHSSNPNLVPDANIVIGGTGANRSLTLTPTPNQSGTANITITASDGATSGSRTFTLTVNPSVSIGQKVYLPLEAESGLLTPPTTAASDAGIPSRRYVFSPVAEQGTVDLTVNVPVADTYVIWGKVLSPSYASDSFYVSVDGGPEDIYDDAEGMWSSDWQWTVVNGRAGTATPAAVSPRLFGLTPGSHTIRFRCREANSTLERILVTNDPDFVPQDLVAANDSLSVTPGTSTTFDQSALLANDSDLFGGALAIGSVPGNSTAGGTIALINGAVEYTPPTGFVGTDSFIYAATNSEGDSSSASVMVDVQPRTSLVVDQGAAQLRFIGIPGTYYNIQASTDLLTWETIATVMADDSGLVTATDPVDTERNLRFYRITLP